MVSLRSRCNGHGDWLAGSLEAHPRRALVFAELHERFRLRLWQICFRLGAKVLSKLVDFNRAE
jgi:hypothetical protein